MQCSELKLNIAIAISSLMMISSGAGAEGSHKQCVPGFTGCFHYGPQGNCDIFLNPPTIETCGFHYGPNPTTPSSEPGTQANAGVVQDSRSIKGTFLVQEQTAECFYNTTTVNRKSGATQPGLVVIHASEDGVSLCNPVALGDACAEQMQVGSASSSGISGVHNMQGGFYTENGFQYSSAFYANAAATIPESSSSTSIAPNATGVVMTITSYASSSLSTTTCHLTRVSN
jgi:hypothetical protein